MLGHLLKFTFLLILSAGISYGLHRYINANFFSGDALELINFSYKFNFGITFLFTSTIILSSKILKDYLGFIFLAGGFVKLAIFLFLMNIRGFEINKEVFLHFFIPYVVCMVVEIIYVIKIIKQSNYQKDK